METSFYENSSKSSRKLGSSNISLDLDSLQKMLLEGLPRVETAKNQDIVMVIGNTGSGKSTTINYQLGCEMDEVFEKGKTVIKTKGEALTPISHEATSGTLYPQVFAKVGSFAYCDCPGFMDTRGKETRICVNITTQLAVKYANSVKAVIVLIDYNELTTGKGKGMRDLAATLSSLFKDPSTISSSLIFIISKAPITRKVTREQLEAGIPELVEGLITAEEGNFNLLKNKFSSAVKKILQSDSEIEADSFARKLAMLELIRASKNIILIDPVDDGESRQRVNKILDGINPIPIKSFDFNEYDDVRIQFNQLIYRIARRGTAILVDNIDLPKRIKSLQEDIEAQKEKIEFYESQIGSLKSGQTSVQATEQRKQALIKRKEEDDILLQKYKVELQKIKSEITKLTEEKKKIDKDVLIQYWEKSIKDERRFLGKWVSWTAESIEYKGIPYEEVHAAASYGKVEVLPDTDKSKGVYKARYTTGWGENGDADFQIWVKTKNKPDNAKRIVDIDKELAKKEPIRKDFEQKIHKLESEIGSYVAFMDTAERGGQISKHGIQLQIQEMESSIREMQLSIKNAGETITTLQKSLATAKIEINEENLRLFKLVYTIASLIEFKSALVNEFLNCFKKFEEIRTEKKLLTSDDEENDNNIPKGFICPISQEIMKDPVQANCGHSFERSQIITYLNRDNSHRGNQDKSKPCPCCKQEIMLNGLRTNYSLKDSIEEFNKHQKLLFSTHDSPLPKRYSLTKYSQLNVAFFSSVANLSIGDQGNSESLIERRKHVESQIKELEKQLYDFRMEYQRINEEIGISEVKGYSGLAKLKEEKPIIIYNLLKLGKVEVLSSDLKRINFSSLQAAKDFVEELKNIGFGNRQMPDEPKKIEALNIESPNESYAVDLTNDEFDALEFENQADIINIPKMGNLD